MVAAITGQPTNQSKMMSKAPFKRYFVQLVDRNGIPIRGGEFVATSDSDAIFRAKQLWSPYNSLKTSIKYWKLKRDQGYDWITKEIVYG